MMRVGTSHVLGKQPSMLEFTKQSGILLLDIGMY